MLFEIKKIQLLTAIIIAALLTGTIYPQLKLCGGIGYLSHLSGAPEGKDTYDSWNTKRYQDVAHYFRDNYSLNAAISYKYSPFTKDTLYAFFVGLEYMSASVYSSSPSMEFILGDELNIQSYTAFIGAGYVPRIGKRNIFLFLTAGLSVKQYQGTSEYGDLHVEQDYETEIVPRVGAGIEYIPVSHFPIAISLEASMDIGNVTRKNVTSFYKGEKAAEFRPTGQRYLPDKSIFYRLTIGYYINI